MSVWAGIDVGDRRKGFHAAAIDRKRLREAPVGLATVEEAVEWVIRWGPTLTAIDSPIAPAPPGASARDEELRLRREICGIRWTPSMDALRRNLAYYGWILYGFELYTALREACVATAECFPTASWTRWSGARGTRTRARWSREALPGLGLGGIPERTNQDVRDAIAAAATARAHTTGLSESLGAIVVPR